MCEREFDNLLIVLGKRLSQDTLTPEGASRVEALVDIVGSQNMSSTIVAFCGGITEGQSRSEASAMLAYFDTLISDVDKHGIGAILIEDASTNTVENIQLLARELVNSGLVQHGSRPINVTLLSNDYHLFRVFTIQRLMDQQGLLKYLIRCCERSGLAINLSYDSRQHVLVPYPHQDVRGRLFAQFDRLTIFRVYLEGAVAQVFSEPLSELVEGPLRIALASLVEMEILVEKDKAAFQPLNEQLPIIRRLIEMASDTSDLSLLKAYLEQLDTLLTCLNRYLDPEQLSFRNWQR